MSSIHYLNSGMNATGSSYESLEQAEETFKLITSRYARGIEQLLVYMDRASEKDDSSLESRVDALLESWKESVRKAGFKPVSLWASEFKFKNETFILQYQVKALKRFRNDRGVAKF